MELIQPLKRRAAASVLKVLGILCLIKASLTHKCNLTLSLMAGRSRGLVYFILKCALSSICAFLKTGENNENVSFSDDESIHISL